MPGVRLPPCMSLRLVGAGVDLESPFGSVSNLLFIAGDKIPGRQTLGCSSHQRALESPPAGGACLVGPLFPPVRLPQVPRPLPTLPPVPPASPVPPAPSLLPPNPAHLTSPPVHKWRGL